MRAITLISLLSLVKAQDVNQFYNVTRLISDGDKMYQDSLSYVQSVNSNFEQLNAVIFVNGTFQSTFLSFDEIQQFFFGQIDDALTFTTDTIELFTDIMERACWTFTTQFENYVQKWTGVNFCFTSYADSTLSSVDNTANTIDQWADTFDVWVLAFKYALGLA